MAEPWRRKPTRRQWLAYWLFVVAALLVLTTLGVAVEIGDRPWAAAVLAATGLIAGVWFVIWVARTARRR